MAVVDDEPAWTKAPAPVPDRPDLFTDADPTEPVPPLPPSPPITPVPPYTGRSRIERLRDLGRSLKR